MTSASSVRPSRSRPTGPAARSRPQARSTPVRPLVTFALLLAPVCVGRAQAADINRVAMAGTFNGWSTADDQYTLQPAGARYELVRRWQCGHYEFKFALNGSWDRHFGGAQGDALTQPGDNIRLTIPQTGSYAVWIDISAKRWGMARRAGDAPEPVIVIRGAESGWSKVDLDGRASVAREGKPITAYRWEITPADAETVSRVSIAEPTSVFTKAAVERAGRFNVSLTVDDGERKSTASIVTPLGFGWRLGAFRANPKPGEAPSAAQTEMTPLPDGTWGGTCRAGLPGKITLSVAPLAASADKGEHVQIDLKAPAKMLVKWDTRRRTLDIRWGGWAELAFDSRAQAKDQFIERVDLVGDFNAWRVGATPMFSLPDGQFHQILELPEGLYGYKLVLNGGVWMNDPKADPRFNRPTGPNDFNSGLLVGDDAASLEPAKPDAVVAAGLKHDPGQRSYFAPIAPGLFEATLRTLADDVQSASVRVAGNDEPVRMTKSDTRIGFDYWTARVASATPTPAYDFIVQDGAAGARLDQEGVSNDMAAKGKPFQPKAAPDFPTPDWAKKAVWYQIFPERFRNGDASNDPATTVPWQHAWFKPYKPDPKKPDGSAAFKSGYVEKGKFYDYVFDRRYGGDLQGVRQKLPYLRDLGVTAIYFNPIFQAESLHKYDASDYRHIDDAFAVKDSRLKLTGETEDPATWQWSESDKLFLDFIKDAHAMGFKVILDGVFNHVGKEFWAFKDVVKNKDKSKYVEWFDVISFEPFRYKGWDRENGELPRLRHDDAKGLSEPVRQHLFGITKRWMDPNGDGDPSDGIDGWRLDVASDVNAHFWRDWRKLVKSINPDAYIVAELWEESKVWLQGDCFDAVMNYEFARRSQRFFVNVKQAMKPSQLAADLKTILSWYAPQVNLVLQNLFDSHDTDRVASMFMNPDLEYDKANRLQDSNPNYNAARPAPAHYEKLRAMVTWQMSFLGAPMVYYGGEVGMYGADDPSDRKPMYWEDLMPFDDPDERIVPGLREHYQRMIALRNTFPSLQLGTYESVVADDEHGVFAFMRTLNRAQLLVVINNSDQAHRLNVPVKWPNGCTVVRLDDPAQAELVPPPADQPKARPTLRILDGKKSGLSVDDGKLHGMMLPPRSAAVFMPTGTK